MNLKKTPIKLKKIPYYLVLLTLTVGASLILGFLSFGGMYALIPILPLAVGAFALSVAYEGEIYLQNIKGALEKLLKPNYLKNHLAKEFLLKNFPDTAAADCPQFFKDYEIQLKLLDPFNHKQLNKASKKRKKQIEKTLKDMEQWFASQLFPSENSPKEKLSDYAAELNHWLRTKEQKKWQELLEYRRFTFLAVKAFSIVSALFMGLGTTYLIVEAFSIIPLFAAIPFVFWPILILPMAVIAGAAYGLLTYNSITDLINNDTINKWYKKLRNDLSQGLTVRNVLMAIAAVALIGLAITLTVCTAGTWWTVASKARPLFDWMRKIPSFVMGIINPIITGLSSLFFVVENTAESLEMIDHAIQDKENPFRKAYNSFWNGLKHTYETENWIQMINPFRIFLKVTITPLRILLFLGHIISIGVTADRMPGLPKILAALIAMISEGFEDAHYFIGNEEDHDEHHHHGTESLLQERFDLSGGHNHDADIPTLILNTLAKPLYLLAAFWDYKAGQQTDHNLKFSQAWNKMTGVSEEQEVQLKDTSPSHAWKVEQTVALIEKYKRKHLKTALLGGELAQEKTKALSQLQTKVRQAKTTEQFDDVLNSKQGLESINKHRFTLFADNSKTNTQLFLEYIPERVNALLPHK